MRSSIDITAPRDLPADTEVLGVPVFQGRVVPAGAPAELDLRFLETSGFDGKVGETLPLLADDGSTIVAVGVGTGGGDPDQVRRAAAAFARAAVQVRRAAFVLPAGSGLDR